MGPMLAALPHDAASRRAEHAIRNHDPCISCSTHFLTLAFERRQQALRRAHRALCPGYRQRTEAKKCASSSRYLSR